MQRFGVLALRVAAVAFVAAISACTSDGQVGDNGVVRFSQVLHFADTDDFTAQLGAKRTLLVALQDPNSHVIDDERTLADFSLEVRKGGSKIDDAWPLGFGQFAINLKDAGSYDLVAVRDGEALDHVALGVTEVDHIRFSQKFDVLSTLKKNDGTTCSKYDHFETGLSDFVLHPNQAISIYVVAADKNDKPLLGLLPVTAKIPDALGSDAPLEGHGSVANALTLWPKSGDGLGSDLKVTVHESELNKDLELTLRTSQDQAVVDCQ